MTSPRPSMTSPISIKSESMITHYPISSESILTTENTPSVQSNFTSPMTMTNSRHHTTLINSQSNMASHSSPLFIKSETMTTRFPISSQSIPKSENTQSIQCYMMSPTVLSDSQHHVSLINSPSNMASPTTSRRRSHNDNPVDRTIARTCHLCNKTLPSKSHLILHMRVHTGERPFKCLVCSRAFTQKGALKRHFDAVHVGTTFNENSYAYQQV